MKREVTVSFEGFHPLRANVTFTPIQLFTAVLPNCKCGPLRLVCYMLRKVLGWVDENGNPTQEQLRFSYHELITKAGLPRSGVVAAINEALKLHLIVRLPDQGKAAGMVEGAIYGLCWDQENPLTHDFERFRGFYYPEATVEEESAGGKVVPRPKAARKNIPNAFFDVVARHERPAVIGVVGTLMFRSIQWGPGGERRQPVAMSITELSRLTNCSRHHTHAAVKEACSKGYLEVVEAGRFHPLSGEKTRTATYAIRWARTDGGLLRSADRAEADLRGCEVSELVKAGPGGSELVQKGERGQFKKVNEKEFKKVNDINIKEYNLKTELKTTATAGALAPVKATVAAAADGFEKLVNAGFDKATARMLSARSSPTVIERQLAWLPLRGATINRMGLLRRAIEHDWPKPEGARPASDRAEAGTPAMERGRLFATHYYAAYHGYSGKAGCELFDRDVQMAAKFVDRLLSHEPNEALIPEWGRRFGRIMRDKHQNQPKARPNLCLTLVPFGNQLLSQVEQEGIARRKEALGKARAAHEEAFQAEYIRYLAQDEIALQKSNAALYEAFLAERRDLRERIFSGPFMTTAIRQETFDSDSARLLAFSDYFARHAAHRVWDFWEWDRKANPNGLSRKPQSPATPEAHP